MPPQIDYFVRKIKPSALFTLMDIGAMGGIPHKWDLLQGNMKVIAFEPDEREYARLKSNSGIHYLNNVVYRESTGIKYFVSKDPGKSSIFRPNEEVLAAFEDKERFSIVKEENFSAAKVKSLDGVMAENTIEDADFIKLDTQGSELAILEGAQAKVLPKVFGINIEVEFMSLYKGQPLFRDIDSFLHQKGFQLMDIRRAYWKRRDFHDYIGKGQLIFGDALYFKRLDTLQKEWALLRDPSLVVSKVYKNVLACLVYRMFDYAVSIVKAAQEQGILTAEECDGAVSQIKSFSKKGMVPSFPGRLFLYKVFRRLCQKLTPPSYLGWADGDDTIGNVKDR